MHLGPTRPFARRLAAALVTVTLALAFVPRGVCAMAEPAAAPADPHACCRSGLQAAQPSCCAETVPVDAARRESAAPASPGAPPAARDVPADAQPAIPCAPAAVLAPSPPLPPLVLRI
jgi:hypothetical protein